MAIKLFKLVGSAVTNTKVAPIVDQYFHTLTAEVKDSEVELLLNVSQFVKDDGATATALKTKETLNGYYNLFINGELQQTGLYTVTSSSLTISNLDGFEIPNSAPITLAVTNFYPISSTVVTV